MDGHAASRQSLQVEEGLGLLNPSEKLDPRSGSKYSISRYINAVTSIVRYLTTLPWLLLLRRAGRFLIPSFLQGPEARQRIRPEQVSQTAYLDGLRGLAALCVFFCHLCNMGFWVGWGWGANGENYNFLKLPIIRLWAEGSGAVALFFVISGYALSYRPLKLIRASNYQDLLTAMSSQTFRRAFRLFLPPIASTFMVVCLIRVGMYELTRPIAYSEVYFHRQRDIHAERWESAWGQWMDWVQGIQKFAHVFSWNQMNDYTTYDVHLWTIPLEFRCSLFLFLGLLGTARLETKYRYLTISCCIVQCWRHCRWELILFFAGMAIAEHDHARGAHIPKHSQTTRFPRLLQVFWVTISILGLYGISMPSYDAATTPGWVWLTKTFVPTWWPDNEECRIGQSVGSALFVLAVGHVDWWKKIFNSFVIQYLGKISYSLYLMHGPALHGFGYLWFKFAFLATGSEGQHYILSYTIAAFLNLLTVIWWADVFWRLIDIPSVQFARWIESKVLKKNN